MNRVLLRALPVIFCTSLIWSQGTELREFTNTQGLKIRARLVGSANGQVTIAREDGQQFTLPLTSLSVADQEFVKQAPPGPARSAPAGFPGPNDRMTPDQVNQAVRAPLFTDTALWDVEAEPLAQRLGLKRESQTKLTSSFRTYPPENVKLFGARPYSVALYAERGRPANLSLVFANKGDLFGAKGSGAMHFDRDAPPEQAAKLLAEAMARDVAAIEGSLRGVLGEPQRQRFGEGGARRDVLRWDWRGHSILLIVAAGEYIGVQVETTAFAESGGKLKRTPDQVVRARVLAELEKRPGGDVVIGDLPMVDQGPKGYCVPATAERAMRHLDVPADMYVLAMAGNSGFGGGTSPSVLLEAVGKDIRRKGRSFDSWRGELNLKELAKHIDSGVPVMWAMFSTELFNETANRRTAERQAVSDWTAWKAKVSSEASSSALTKDESRGHVVLITGYNKDTGEIAFSDSWGERFKERWITLAEAEKVSQKGFWAVGF